ncbi:uncharacterized protein Z518_10538 [Rhinocladiella mackenziei CBS 650.93]|uniref:Major facilitator superfamily (MFS) profile domain-containing protein n=1 Tax=Rhinocladiella mackenziei CBS 650.93 TaxID=1442369 RepID=A0A0D2I3N8_9EURO|nr:uncharacterized protein Z518_10538 [Rhinocladiella mackenziei CBS 650.93]KIX00399.1 hypothetical protein Z518_10538 [Rhinocladiella mackenziei CBS 650.93]
MLYLGLGTFTSALGIAVVFASSYASPSVWSSPRRKPTFRKASHPTPRGPLLAFFPVFFLIVLDLQQRPGRTSYLTAIASEWPFSVISVTPAICMPESPVYLIRRGNLAGALKAQKRLDSPQVDSRANLNQLQASIRHEEGKASANGPKYVDCLRNTDLRRTGIVALGVLAKNWRA